MPKVLVPLADGVEEMEAVIVIDVLRRADWDVAAVGLKEGAVTASRGVRLQPDTVWSDIEPAAFDMLVIPGGAGGTENLSNDTRVLEAVRDFASADKWLAAICAGPLVLQAAGVLKGRKATCHPGAAQKLTEPDRQQAATVVDGRIVTSQGPGTAFDFALRLVALVDGEPVADSLAASMVLKK